MLLWNAALFLSLFNVASMSIWKNCRLFLWQFCMALAQTTLAREALHSSNLLYRCWAQGKYFSQNTRSSISLCFGLIQQEAESLEAGFLKVWYRQDWRRYQRSHRIQRHFPWLACKGTLCTWLSVWGTSQFSLFPIQGEASKQEAIHHDNPQLSI